MKYQNPIIRGFNPDPSVCRVGEDYYLVTSTFEYFPGIPVYHSRDLVNWACIGHCIDRPDQLTPLQEATPANGIWAPTIRYYDGVYYVTATCHGVGNFFVTAENPAGPWSDPIYVPIGGIDPSMFFEDGKCYYCTNLRGGPNRSQGVTVGEIDVTTGQFVSDLHFVWDSTGGGYAEAPHIYHIGEWYYTLMAEGGTGFMHMVTIARSKNLYGPYESCPHNPIITNRHDDTKSIACTGHADLFEDHLGNWWMVHLATRPAHNWNSHIGRESFLMPVTWENGWPKVEGKAMSLIEPDGPLTAPQQLPETWQADFSKRDLSWLNIRTPQEENYLWEKSGLVLTPSLAKITDELGHPTFIGQRQFDMDATITATLRFAPRGDGEEAGFTTYISNEYFYKICKRRENGKDYILVQKQCDDFFQEVYREEVGAGDVTFTLQASKPAFDFSYSIENGQLIHAARASTRFLACEVARRCFTGVVFGVYATCDAPTDTRAVLTDFTMKRS